MATAPVSTKMAPPGDNVNQPDRTTKTARLNHLRMLRAEVQDLQAILHSVRDGNATLATYAEYITQTVKDITELVVTIPASDALDSDTIRHIHNLLEQMQVNPLLKDPNHSYDAQEQLQYISLLDTQCRKLVLQVGFLTIPERVNSWLKAAWPGYYVPFHAVFEDELPTVEDRVRVLNHLAWAPKTVTGGIVDPASGLIYKHAQTERGIALSILLVIGACVAAVGIVLGFYALPPNIVPGTLPQSSLTFLAQWIAVVAGVIFHIIVGTAKQFQAQPDRPPILALNTFPLIISAKIGQILFRLLLTLVGSFALVFGYGADQVTLLNAFLVGYSLDSIVDLFGTSAEQRAGTQVATLRRQLGVTTQQ